MRSNNRHNKKSHRNRGGTGGGKAVIPHPGPNVSALHQTMTLRFTTLAGYAGNITFSNLLDAVLVGLTTTALGDVFQFVRIKRVRIWANGLTNAAVSLELSFNGNTTGIVGDCKMHTGLSMGIEPAYIDCRPSPKTMASDFQVNSSAIAWYMDIPIGAVLDVTLDYKNSLIGTPAASGVIGSGITVGAFYLRGLDGVAAATSKFSPVGSTNVA